jgi:vanillate/3-O-methylgallate O-demethylase
MSSETLAAALARAGSPVELLRNLSFPPSTFPVKPEFTNWRSEQRSWVETCALLDQSHHMTDLFIEGPDALRLLSDVGVNTFANFGVGKAKQFVAVNPDGHLIGDAILFHLEEELFDLVGHPMVIDWVTFNLERGDYEATVERDDNSAVRVSGPPKLYRYELQGPTAAALIEQVSAAPLPDVKFFNMAEFTIAGRRVRGLRHGMAGQPGFELFGPAEEGDTVKDALVVAGQEFGLRLVGARAYSSNTLESGWIPSPMPAIYSGDERMKKYREWLKANGFEGNASLGGSYYSTNIEDYYLTPYDLGYGAFVKFDHDFIGREALEKIANKPHKVKVTLELNDEDVTKAIASQFGKENERAKYIDFPSAVYSMYPFDRVMKDGKLAGLSTWVGYSSNERKMLTLAVLDPQYAKPGTEVTFVWGEENGGSRKPTVERHKQVEIRAVVCPVPYVASVRTGYADGGWRATGKL